jgi:hypothetical protein
MKRLKDHLVSVMHKCINNPFGNLAVGQRLRFPGSGTVYEVEASGAVRRVSAPNWVLRRAERRKRRELRGVGKP